MYKYRAEEPLSAAQIPNNGGPVRRSCSDRLLLRGIRVYLQYYFSSGYHRTRARTLTTARACRRVTAARPAHDGRAEERYVYTPGSLARNTSGQLPVLSCWPVSSGKSDQNNKRNNNRNEQQQKQRLERGREAE